MKKIIILLLLLIFSFSPVFAKEKIEVTQDGAGIYIFKINTKKYGSKIKPYVSKKLTTPKKVYDDECFDLVVNAGYFDVKNGKSVSYIVVNNELISDPKDNPELTESLKQEGRLEKVLSRGELRILETKRHKLKFDIAYHNEPIEKKYKAKHILQAGPILLPQMDLAQEGFVIYDDDMVKFQSADILKRRERTAIGLKGKYFYIVIFTKDNKVDAKEMRDYLLDELKLDKALAFDGGLSTAINYKDISIGSLGKYQRKVKSFLVIER